METANGHANHFLLFATADAAEAGKEESAVPLSEDALDLPANSQIVAAHLPASVWQILVQKGAEVAEGDRLVVLESMKMEIPIAAESSGVVKEVKVNEGDFVNEDDVLVVLE